MHDVFIVYYMPYIALTYMYIPNIIYMCMY